MSFQRQRLERLLGMLASERTQGRDLRASVMRALKARGAVRTSSPSAWKLGGCMAAMVGAWIGAQSLLQAHGRVDLGEIGRASAEWISPSQSRETPTMTPVRLLPRPRAKPPVATAPWPRI